MHPLWKEYCKKSSLHGMHYIVTRGRPLFERAVWLMLIIAGGVGIAMQILLSWHQYYSGSVQVIVQNPRFDLSYIDFPAITVCSFKKINMVRANAVFERMFGNNSDEETRESFMYSLVALTLLRYPYYNNPNNYIFTKNLTKLYHIKNADIVNIMKEVNPRISDMIEHCFWRGSSHNCEDIFRFQPTEDGFCYSFNSRTSFSPSVSSKIKNSYQKQEILRNNAAGKITGLEILFHFPKIENQVPQEKLSLDGYSILVHDPNELPDVTRNIAIVESFPKVYRIMVSVSRTEGDSSLKHLDDRVRGCQYTEKGGRSVSLTHCLTRCRTKKIKTICKCVPYFVRSNNSETKTDTCGIQHLDCLNKINPILPMTSSTDGSDGFPYWVTPGFDCNCPQLCSYVTYDTDVSVTYPILAKMPYTYGNYFAYVDVSYKHPWAISYVMQAKFGLSDCLVALGGVAGLLLGCSLLSLIEILYYMGRYIQYKLSYRKSKLFPYLP